MPGRMPFATVRHVDRIIVIAGGRVVESGTHDELMRQDGLYRRLMGAQADAGEAELLTHPAAALPQRTAAPAETAQASDAGPAPMHATCLPFSGPGSIFGPWS